MLARLTGNPVQVESGGGSWILCELMSQPNGAKPMTYHNPSVSRSPGRQKQISGSRVSYTTKEANRGVTEHEVVPSDRVPMIGLANDFVEKMVNKQTVPLAEQGISVADCVTFTDSEEKTYHAALGYLARQFSMGSKDSESIVIRVESDSEVEVKHTDVVMCDQDF